MKVKNAVIYLILIAVAVVFGYPILWLFCSSFKDSASIFSSIGLIPEHFTFEGYIEGWKNTSQYPFSLYLGNSLRLVIITVLLTCVSSCLVAYGFTRFDFPFKRVLFGLMISTMMLPNTIIMIPRYILFNNMGVLNSYMPFYLIAAFAANPFFTYLLMQFFRGIPIELDESAKLDGVSTLGGFYKIVVPLSTPGIAAGSVLVFVNVWNDWLISATMTISEGMRLINVGLFDYIKDLGVDWGKFTAYSLLSILPILILFLSVQKYFIQGLTAGATKG